MAISKIYKIEILDRAIEVESDEDPAKMVRLISRLKQRAGAVEDAIGSSDPFEIALFTALDLTGELFDKEELS